MRLPTTAYNGRVHNTNVNRICHSPHLSPLESSKTSEGKVIGLVDERPIKSCLSTSRFHIYLTNFSGRREGGGCLAGLEQCVVTDSWKPQIQNTVWTQIYNMKEENSYLQRKKQITNILLRLNSDHFSYQTSTNWEKYCFTFPVNLSKAMTSKQFLDQQLQI